jgi:hypothetical protein
VLAVLLAQRCCCPCPAIIVPAPTVIVNLPSTVA